MKRRHLGGTYADFVMGVDLNKFDKPSQPIHRYDEACKPCQHGLTPEDIPQPRGKIYRRNCSKEK